MVLAESKRQALSAIAASSTTAAITTVPTILMSNGGVEKIHLNGGKVLQGILPEDDSGWDDSSSDGSFGETGTRTEEQRELRNRRAAAAR